MGRLDWEWLVKQILEAGPHYGDRFWETFKGTIFQSGPTINQYLAGKRKSYQGPASYFILCFIAFSIVAQLAHMASIETGSFGSVDKWLFLAASIVPISVSHWLVMRSRFTFIETLVGFTYIYGTTFLILPLFIILQIPIRSQMTGFPPSLRFLVMDVPFVILSGIMAFTFVRQQRLSISRAVVAMLFAIGYFLVFRHVVVHELTF